MVYLGEYTRYCLEASEVAQSVLGPEGPVHYGLRICLSFKYTTRSSVCSTHPDARQLNRQFGLSLSYDDCTLLMRTKMLGVLAR